ncbi:MAG: GntR family transcriptional regulator [Emergencia sp.]|nr:GntR family transcriptional regulator [Emergencia sp.]
MKVKRTSLVDQIYDLILEKIQNRELVPGDRLNIEELAKTFSVSRTPVRETINRLIQEGFVEQKHNVGPSIIKLSEEEELELIDANSYLFDIVIDTYQGLNTLKFLIEELEEIIAEQKVAYEADDEQGSHKASDCFHQTMIEYCTNRTIRECAAKTQNQINMCTFAYQAVSENRRQSIIDHTEILQALKQGDIDKTKRLMNAHNKFSGTTYMKRKLNLEQSE